MNYYASLGFVDKGKTTREDKDANKEIVTRFIHKAFHILPKIYTANHATVPIQIYVITV